MLPSSSSSSSDNYKFDMNLITYRSRLSHIALTCGCFGYCGAELKEGSFLWSCTLLPLLLLGRPLCAFNSFQFAAVQFNSNLTPFKSTTRPNIKCGSLSPALPRSLSLSLWQQVRHLENVVCGRLSLAVWQSIPSRVATKIPVRPKYDEANVLENQKAARKANTRI